MIFNKQIHRLIKDDYINKFKIQYMPKYQKHIVIVRTNGSTIDYNTYNCQEVGLAKALISKGYNVSIIFAGDKYNHITEKVNNSLLNIYYLPYFSIHHTLAWFKGFSKLLKTIKPDIVQIHDLGNFMSYWAVRWAKNHSVKSVLIQGGYQVTLKPIFKQSEILFNNTLGKFIIRKVDAIGCKTIKAKEYINNIYNKNVFITPVGLDASRFCVKDKDINWREELNIIGKNILLYIGVLEGRRNIELLIHTLELLPENYVLLIAGDGSELENTKRTIKSLNLENRCHLLGKLEQTSLPSLYKCADLFLLASNYEIYGMVILESMYFGLPVISSFTAGSQTIIDDNYDGVLVEKFNKHIWADTIASTIEDKVKLNIMSVNAHDKIHTKLLWENAVDNFISIYKSFFN